MLCGNGNDNGIEFTALGFMNGNSVGKRYFRQILARICNGSLISELNQAGVVFKIDVRDPADIPVEYTQVIVIAGLNHSVTFPEDPIPDLYLSFPLRLGVDSLLNALIQVERSQAAPDLGR